MYDTPYLASFLLLTDLTLGKRPAFPSEGKNTAYDQDSDLKVKLRETKKYQMPTYQKICKCCILQCPPSLLL